jgi:Tol biopolymer transport system component
MRVTALTAAVCAMLVAAATGAAGPADTYPNADVYRLTLAGARVPLARSPALDTSPAVSPNGRKIAFVSSRDGAPDLYTMNAAGGGLRRLTRSPLPAPADTPAPSVAWNDAGSTTIAWSPDGTRLAFDVQAIAPPPGCMTNCVGWSIWVVGADGTGLRMVTAGRTPSWSPGGRRLAFWDATPYGEGEALGIVMLGGAAKEVPAFTPDPSQPAVWAPGGRELAFSALAKGYDGGPPTVFAVRPDGSGLRRVATGAEPDWSRDGRSIAYVRSRRLYAIAATGKGERRLSAAGEAASAPAWSRGSRRVAFVGWTKAAGSRIGVVGANGLGERHLAALPPKAGVDAGPVWDAAGTSVVVAVWR